jgi:hypothetical protein
MELLDDVGHVESCFGLFGDSISVGARCGSCGIIVCVKRIMGSEISLDAPEGTPMWRGSSASSFWSIWGLL